MQEKEKINKQLSALQIQCVKEYLENKLETITTKEVVSDILQGFIEINNVEFMQNITENILQAKTNNKNLRKEIETLRCQHALQIEEMRTSVTEERDRASEKMYNQMKSELTEKCSNYKLQIKNFSQKVREIQEQNKNKSQENQVLKQNLKQYQEKQKTLKEELEKSLKELKLLKEVTASENQLKDKINLTFTQQLASEKEILISKLTQMEQTFEEFEKQKIEELQEKNIQIDSLKKEITSLHSQNRLLLTQNLQILGQSQQLKQKIEQSQDRLKSLQNDKRAIELAHKYIQQENQYLREEIIQFNNRKQQIQEEKNKIALEFDIFRNTTNKDIETLNLTKLNLQEQLKQQKASFKQQMTNSKQLYEEQTTILQTEIEQLKTFTQQYRLLLSQKQESLEQSNRQLQNTKQQNKCMHLQIKLHTQQNQIHENQIKCYEQQLLKTNQQCRAQLETYKQTYQLNWNSLNEQLIEERYKNQQLRENVDKLKEELSLQKEKQSFYNQYVEEIAHLKRQLEVVTSAKKYIFDRSQLKIGDVKEKFFYYISKINQELKQLKKDNKELKTKLLAEATQYKNYFQETLSYLVAKIKEQSLKCSFCEHQKNLKKQVKSKEHFELKFQKTMPKVSLSEAPSLSNLKKNLKNIQQRYHAINQQNKFYTEHIETIMKRT